MSYIEPQIKRYIDSAAEAAARRASLKFRADMEHERGILIEEFQSRLTLMGETIDLKNRETTREVIRQEVMPRFDLLDTKMSMVIDEIVDLKDEMKLLRKDSSLHNARLTRLERAAA